MTSCVTPPSCAGVARLTHGYLTVLLLAKAGPASMFALAPALSFTTGGGSLSQAALS